MKLKYNINFRLEQRKDRETNEIIKHNVPINLDFTFDGKRFVYYTGYRIDYGKWDFETQRVKKNNINTDRKTSQEINSHINEVASTIESIYKESKALKVNPSTQYLRDELRKRLNEVETGIKKIFEVFDIFLESETKARNWTKATLTKIRTTLGHLKNFQEKKRYTIEFDSINDKFFEKYVDYLREDLGHINTTIAKNLKIFRWFMNWATKKGYNKNLAYKDYNPEFKGTSKNNKIIFLTWAELMHLYNLKIKKNYLNQIRDVFCFCCFTGLRYSDVYNLKRSNIKNDSIEFTTIKTDETLIIDLNDYSRAILNKYKEYPFEDNKCLPVISNQKFNDYLKELGKFAELNTPETIVYYKGAERIEKTYEKHELLTTHVGRKTFVTNALFFNIPAEVIMKWTGHKDHKVMENYYKIIGEQRRREMNKFNQ